LLLLSFLNNNNNNNNNSDKKNEKTIYFPNLVFDKTLSCEEMEKRRETRR
jgi:hypothetical protein